MNAAAAVAYTAAMDLQFLGATDTVTGSKYLVTHQGRHLLVDCGLFQGYKALRLRNWQPLPVDAASIDAVILTHAHIDHSGYVPLLIKQGFKGPVYCTAATRDLCAILLPDSGHLMEEEAEYANRHGFSKHAPALPLYGHADAIAAMNSFRTVEWDHDFEPLPGLRARLAPAGHMPGASFVRLDDGQRSILFSGDVGRADDMLLKPPRDMAGADYLVVESTYGDRSHEQADVVEQLGDIIRRTAARGGTVVIPAFAVGRAQALLHVIRLLRQRDAIPYLPVYLNSPMATEALEVYRRHAAEMRLPKAEIEALAGAAQIVRSAEESIALNARRGPMVIIAASGMATGGRVVHHLKAFAPDHRSTIVLAGFQSGGTRGAALEQGASTIRIHGQEVPVRAEIAKISALSAHADGPGIVEWLRKFTQKPRCTFITHGEPDAADAMRQRIERTLHWDCRLPYYLEKVSLD